jgi:propane monooxygenase large subunit
VPQPHLHFDDSKMWTLDDVKGHKLGSPLLGFRALTDEGRAAAAAEYRKGFVINPLN